MLYHRTVCVLCALFSSFCCHCFLTSPRSSILSSEPTECENFEFRCNNSRCITERWRCDGTDDCQDNSDEDPVMCEAVQCATGQYRCPSTSIVKCIPESWVCDGNVDCDHNKIGHSGVNDETNCTHSCSSGMFTCNDGACIPSLWQCDGAADCKQAEDETNCTTICDTKTQMKCDSGECVNQTMRCDGDKDCADGSDEFGCISSTTAVSTCDQSMVMCDDGSACIYKKWVCDGEVDCTDGSDEVAEKCRVSFCTEGEFQCGGIGECIDDKLVCDGVKHCRDGKDENDTLCKECDSSSEFTCRDGTCVPLSHVCDGVAQCGDGSDEGAHCNASVNKCHDKSGHGVCSHKCSNTPQGARCHCDEGYKLQSDAKTCKDINECKKHGVCSHECVNTPGSFKCLCRPGYTLDPANTRFCKADVGGHSLLLAHRTDIRMVDVHTEDMRAVVTKTMKPTDIDYHYSSRTVFWTDQSQRAIYKASMDDAGDNSEVILSKIQCFSVAVDWVNNHLYMVKADEDHQRSIAVTGLHTARYISTLITSGLNQPQFLRLDPVNGWMYWLDIGEKVIESAGMDGSYRRVLVNAHLVNPSGLTVDLVSGRLFWTDSKLRLIESVALDGSRRRVVISDLSQLPHPFSVAVFEDSVYWTDMTSPLVFSANKFTGANVSVVASQGQESYQVVVRVFHQYMQPNITQSYCQPLNGHCSHLCLPRPKLPSNSHKSHLETASSSVSCKCPDSLQLDVDGKRCVQMTHKEHSKSSSDGVQGRVVMHGAVTRTDDNVISASAVAAIVFGSLFFILCVLLMLGVFVYRYYGRGFRQLNFDNPIYKKTTVVNSVKFDRSRTPFSSRPTEESLMPLTRSQEELVNDE